MSYIPLKKDIVFSDSVKNNPCYPAVMFILKTLGDSGFKHQAVSQLFYLAGKHQESRGLLEGMANNIQALVNREVSCDHATTDKALNLISEFDPDLFNLLNNITSFILNIQNMEKAILSIDKDIDSGKITSSKRQLTKDGEAPVYLPRSRQTNQGYRRR